MRYFCPTSLWCRPSRRFRLLNYSKGGDDTTLCLSIVTRQTVNNSCLQEMGYTSHAFPLWSHCKLSVIDASQIHKFISTHPRPRRNTAYVCGGWSCWTFSMDAASGYWHKRQPHWRLGICGQLCAPTYAPKDIETGDFTVIAVTLPAHLFDCLVTMKTHSLRLLDVASNRRYCTIPTKSCQSYVTFSIASGCVHWAFLLTMPLTAMLRTLKTQYRLNFQKLNFFASQGSFSRLSNIPIQPSWLTSVLATVSSLKMLCSPLF